MNTSATENQNRAEADSVLYASQEIIKQKKSRVITLSYCFFLLWLAGIGLRLTILAPAPVISFIHADLNMSETQIGLFSGMPAALFACAAVLGALLIARFGAFTTVIVGLLTTAVGSVLRAAVPDVSLLYATTVLTGLGVALMQPSMPSLVREWLPNHIRLATAVYINGLLIGEVLPVGLSLPFVLPLVGSWRADFVFWGVACAIIALILFVFAPRQTVVVADTVARKWWPDWRNKMIWQLGIMLGTMNALYFSTNFFIPRYLQVTGHGSIVSQALTALNGGQLPASILLLFVVRGLERRAWPYIGCALLCLVSLLSIVFGNNLMIICGASLLGFSTASVLILMLALPALLSPPEDEHRTAAAMLTISYSCALIVPIISGISWDVTGMPAMAFAPLGLCAFMLIILASIVNIHPYQK